MKYLKLFEQIKKYSIIPYSEIRDRDEIDMQSFSDKELSLIKDVFINKEGVNIRSIKSDSMQISYKNSTDARGPVGPLRDRYVHSIGFFKGKDEWFYVIIKSIVYKCDQIDGLLKCLEDNI